MSHARKGSDWAQHFRPPPVATLERTCRDVGFVPTMKLRAHSITSSAATGRPEALLDHPGYCPDRLAFDNAPRDLLAFRHRQRQTGSAPGRRHDPAAGPQMRENAGGRLA